MIVDALLIRFLLLGAIISYAIMFLLAGLYMRKTVRESRPYTVTGIVISGILGVVMMALYLALSEGAVEALNP